MLMFDNHLSFSKTSLKKLLLVLHSQPETAIICYFSYYCSLAPQMRLLAAIVSDWAPTQALLLQILLAQLLEDDLLSEPCEILLTLWVSTVLCIIRFSNKKNVICNKFFLHMKDITRFSVRKS